MVLERCKVGFQGDLPGDWIVEVEINGQSHYFDKNYNFDHRSCWPPGSEYHEDVHFVCKGGAESYTLLVLPKDLCIPYVDMVVRARLLTPFSEPVVYPRMVPEPGFSALIFGVLAILIWRRTWTRLKKPLQR